jgi:hypothetical protein
MRSTQMNFCRVNRNAYTGKFTIQSKVNFQNQRCSQLLQRIQVGLRRHGLGIPHEHKSEISADALGSFLAVEMADGFAHARLAELWLCVVAQQPQ